MKLGKEGCYFELLIFFVVQIFYGRTPLKLEKVLAKKVKKEIISNLFFLIGTPLKLEKVLAKKVKKEIISNYLQACLFD